MDEFTNLDRRIAYGAGCLWWGPIQAVGVTVGGLPCCPQCRGLLFEMDSEAVFLAAAKRYEEDQARPGYVTFIRWLKGRCFKTQAAAEAAYAADTETHA